MIIIQTFTMALFSVNGGVHETLKLTDHYATFQHFRPDTKVTDHYTTFQHFRVCPDPSPSTRFIMAEPRTTTSTVTRLQALKLTDHHASFQHSRRCSDTSSPMVIYVHRNHKAY